MAVKASCTVTLSCYRDTQSVTRYYKLQSSTASAPSIPTTNPPSGWDDTEPSYTSGSTNTLYFCDLTVFSDGTWAYSSVSKSSSYEAAKEAYNKAQNAQNTVNNLEVGGRNYILNGKGDVQKGFFTNFTKVENGYGELTISSANQYSHIDLKPGYLLDCRDYEVGKQVTFSFDIMVTRWDAPDGSDIYEWWIGQRYADAPSGETATGTWRTVTYMGLPRVGMGGCVLNEWMHISKVFTIPEQASSNVATVASIQLYNRNADTTVTVTIRIKNVKLEYGNKETDWTPAPEDVESDIDDAQSTADQAQSDATDAHTRISEAESVIQQLKDCIAMLVVDESGASLMTQTEDGWVFSMAETAQAMSDLANALDDLEEASSDTKSAVNTLTSAVNDLGELGSYVRITTDNSKPCIELGTGNSDFKLLITNTDIRFMEGSSVPAYINNQSLYIRKAVINEELQQGNWVWKVRSNGNLGLVWKGSGS